MRAGKKQGLLFWRKEAKDFYVAVAVLSGSVRPGRKRFLVLFFKKEPLLFPFIGSEVECT
jgi:hypothetical protein